MRTRAPTKRACLRILSSQPSLRSRWRRSRKPLQDGVPANRGADGRRLWRQHGVARGRDGVGAELRRRHPAADIGLEARRRPPAPKSFNGDRRPPKLMRRDKEHRPLSVKELALGLPGSDWETIIWREGACEPLSSRFARVRVRPAHRDYDLTAPRPEEWLLIEWPEREAEPTKYWFSTLPEDIDFTSLVDITKLRWRIDAIISISNRRSASAITKAAAGAAFATTARSVSPPTPSSSPSGKQLPPQDLVAPGNAERLKFPEAYKPRGHAAKAGEAHPKLNCNA